MIKVATLNRGTCWALCSDVRAECIKAGESLGFEYKHDIFYCKGRKVAWFSGGYVFDHQDDHRRYEVIPAFPLIASGELPSVAWVKRHLCVYRLWLEEEQ